MNNFEYCIDLILKLEGGFVNHPSDRGGPTNFGITQRTLSYHREKPANAQDVKSLTAAEAEEIYLAQFWNPIGLGRVPSWRVALVLFAHVVHTGQLSAIKALQKTLNVHFGEKLFIDGIFGARTELALIKIQDDRKLCQKLLQTIQVFYIEICEKRPEHLVFLRGWLNRSFAVWDAIS